MPQSTRLYHAVVLCGFALGALPGCGDTDRPTPSAVDQPDTDGLATVTDSRVAAHDGRAISDDSAATDTEIASEVLVEDAPPRTDDAGEDVPPIDSGFDAGATDTTPAVDSAVPTPDTAPLDTGVDAITDEGFDTGWHPTK